MTGQRVKIHPILSHYYKNYLNETIDIFKKEEDSAQEKCLPENQNPGIPSLLCVQSTYANIHQFQHPKVLKYYPLNPLPHSPRED
jgi:hypothetical protein